MGPRLRLHGGRLFAGMRDVSPPPVFTGAGSRREDKGKGAGISGGGKGVFHVGMVAREGEFRQWRHVSRWWKKRDGFPPSSSRGQDLDARTTGGGKGVFHGGMVAREGEFRQWRHVSRWWKKRDGSPPSVFTGAGSRREDKGKGKGSFSCRDGSKGGGISAMETCQ